MNSDVSISAQNFEKSFSKRTSFIGIPVKKSHAVIESILGTP